MSKLLLTASSTEKRQSQIRKARSVNDLLNILSDITEEVDQNSKVISGLIKSLSSSKARRTSYSARRPADLDEIKISHTGKGPLSIPTTKIRTKAEPATSVLGVKLEKFVVPPLKDIESSLGIVQSLYDNARELESVEALLSQAFAGSKNQPQALKSVKALRAEVDSSTNTALQTLQRIADKHMPTEMRLLNTKIIGFVLDTLDPTTYSNITEIVYVAPGKDKTLLFSLYLCLHDLKDGDNFTYNEFYIVLTGVIRGGNINYYLNTLPDFKVPGSYPIGKEVTNEKSAVNRIKLLLSANDVVQEFERRPLGITKTELQTKNVHTIPFVSSAEVKDDAIIVHLKANTPPDKYNAVVTQLLPLLKSVMGITSRSRSVFKSKIVKTRSTGQAAIHFILTPDVRSDETQALTMNLVKLAELQKALDLTPEEVHSIKQGLKKHL